MKHELTNGTLTIFLEGEMNSLSSDGIEKEIDVLIEENEFQSLVLDMTELRYMSSAGIRVVMRLKQQYGDVFLNNMTDDIYDIFLMVGLTNVFEIKRLSKK